MSKVIHCIEHKLQLLLPTTNNEHVTLSSQITRLLNHLKEYPTCKFVEGGVA